MTKESIAYCGLNCEKCMEKFHNAREKAKILSKELEKINFEEVAKVIPFMKKPYKGFKKTMDFLLSESECPGCRNGGGNPFCGIRKHAIKKGYFTCAECEIHFCKKFDMLFKVHIDNEIQNNIEKIKELGIEAFVESE